MFAQRHREAGSTATASWHLSSQVFALKRGWRIFAYPLVAVLCGVGAAYMLFEAFILKTTSLSPYMFGSALLVIAAALWYVPLFVTTRFTVTSHYLRLANIAGTRRVAFEDVRAVRLPTNLVGGYNLAITFKEGGKEKSVFAPISLFRNPAEVAKAVVEATYWHSPDAFIDSEAHYFFGLPPYGMFEWNERTEENIAH